MCLLIAKRAGIALPDEWTEICRLAADCNRDGTGYAVRRPSGTIARYRSVTDSPDRFAQASATRIGVDDDAIIHFRFATGSRCDKANCHPFSVRGGVFAHNGVLPSPYVSTNDRSDTARLAEESRDYDDLRAKLTALSGAGNKFAAMTHLAPGLEIFGEQHGSYIDDIWYSNTSWMDTGYGRDDCAAWRPGAVTQEIAELVEHFGLRAVEEAMEDYKCREHWAQWENSYRA